jgi:hypothetical protein
MSDKPKHAAEPDDADKPDLVERGDDYDLDFEKDVAPEENIPWLPHPSPSDGDAPAP